MRAATILSFVTFLLLCSYFDVARANPMAMPIPESEDYYYAEPESEFGSIDRISPQSDYDGLYGDYDPAPESELAEPEAEENDPSYYGD